MHDYVKAVEQNAALRDGLEIFSPEELTLSRPP
jgi:hypothetical protein